MHGSPGATRQVRAKLLQLPLAQSSSIVHGPPTAWGTRHSQGLVVEHVNVLEQTPPAGHPHALQCVAGSASSLQVRTTPPSQTRWDVLSSVIRPASQSLRQTCEVASSTHACPAGHALLVVHSATQSPSVHTPLAHWRPTSHAVPPGQLVVAQHAGDPGEQPGKPRRIPIANAPSCRRTMVRGYPRARRRVQHEVGIEVEMRLTPAHSFPYGPLMVGVGQPVRVVVAIVLAVASAGCSLARLDDLGYVTCTDDAPCDALGRAQGRDLAACTNWQCNEGLCRLVQRDADRDGHLRAACFTDGTGDCDDAATEIHPGASEVCDGRDQDCDLGIDEGTAAGVADENFVRLVPVASGSRLLASTSLAEGGVALSFVDDRARGVIESVTSTLPFTASAPLAPELVLDLGASPRTRRCAVAADTRDIPIPDACTSDGDCAPGRVCRVRADGRRVCGSFTGTCTTDAECADADLCNGAERCVPGAPEADGRGCAGALSDACASDELCDARTASCVATVACDVADLAAAPGDGDVRIAAMVSDHCAVGSLRLVSIPADAGALRTTGDTARTTALFALDPDASDCTGASRAGAPGVSGLALASLPRTALSQALVAYRTAATGETGVEIVGAWLERDASGTAWVSASGDGVPVPLPAPAAASVVRPGVAAFESARASGFVVAYARAGGGVATVFVPELPASAPACPVGSTPTEVCLSGGSVLVPSTATAPRTTPELGTPSTSTVGTDAVVGDVSIALRASSTADAEVALAYATASEVILRIGTLDAGVFDLAAEHRLSAAGALDVSIVRVGRGLALPNARGVPEGGLLIAWHDATATWVVRVHGDATSPEQPSAPLAVGGPLFGPRAAFLDERLVLIGARPGEIDLVPLTCPMAAP